MANTCVKIVVSGVVQGVFFRATTKEVADGLGLAGKVWNNTNGTVGILACGDKEKVAELVRWCHTGPDAAHVSEVQVEKTASQEFSSFSISS